MVHGNADPLVHVLVVEDVVTVAGRRQTNTGLSGLSPLIQVHVQDSGFRICLPEGTSLYVLTRQSDVDPFFQQRSKGHVLSQSPVHRPVTNHLGSTLQDTTQT